MTRATFALCTVLAAAVQARPSPEPPPDIVWRPGVPVELCIAPGRATTVLLRTPRKISAISLASPIIDYRYDKKLNQLEIAPAVRAAGGETNLNVRIGPDIYVLLVKVVDDVRAQVLQTFILADEAEEGDEEALAHAPVLKPQDIDLVEAAQAMERAAIDPAFRQAHSECRIEALDGSYDWNGCEVELNEAAQFVDRDLLVFRIQWVNRTAEVLYLDPLQYGLRVAGQPIPVAARYKLGSGPLVFPGQLETVYLAVQGSRLSRRNEWQLALPPDGDAVGRLLLR